MQPDFLFPLNAVTPFPIQLRTPFTLEPGLMLPTTQKLAGVAVSLACVPWRTTPLL